MTRFPAYARILHPGGWSESFPQAIRVEMDSGPAKQVRKESRLTKTVTATVLFETAADALAFERWYDQELDTVGFFLIRHPLLGVDVEACFVGGDIGALVPSMKRFAMSQRTVKMEYRA